MIKKYLLSALLFSMGGHSFACSVPPEDSRSLPIEAVMDARSAGVVVFSKVKSTPDGIEFSGSLLELLWGSEDDLKAVFYRTSGEINYTLPAGDVGRHDTSDFWIGNVANTGYGRDCMLVPNIKLGVRYIFLRTPNLGGYSIESIQGIDDPWYRLVKKMSMRVKKRK